MSEDKKPETPVENPIGEIKVPVQDLPSRADIRQILKTGHDTKGQQVHPESVKMLRVARIADLFAFGQEVNKANAELVNVFKLNLEGIDLNFKEVHWNFATFISFLAESGYLKEGALDAFAEFKKKAEDDLIKGSKELLEKAEAAKVVTPEPELTKAAVVERPVISEVESLPPSDK